MNISFGKTVIIRDNSAKKQIAADPDSITIVNDKNKKYQYEIIGNAQFPLMFVENNPNNISFEKFAEKLQKAKKVHEDSSVPVIDINA